MPGSVTSYRCPCLEGNKPLRFNDEDKVYFKIHSNFMHSISLIIMLIFIVPIQHGNQEKLYLVSPMDYPVFFLSENGNKSLFRNFYR
jgi:hypothetical protein